MSSAGRKGVVRVDKDVYPTPRWAIDLALENIDLQGTRWLEPCAGEGAIVRTIKDHSPDIEVTACELRDTRSDLVASGADHVRIDNFLETFHTFGLFDTVFTNPPYSLAMEFVQASLQVADHVCMLLRVNFLGSEHRADWLRDHLPDVYILPNRPSFTKGGTDSTEYAWMQWHRSYQGGRLEILPLTPLSVRRADLTGSRLSTIVGSCSPGSSESSITSLDEVGSAESILEPSLLLP